MESGIVEMMENGMVEYGNIGKWNLEILIVESGLLEILMVESGWIRRKDIFSKKVTFNCYPKNF